MAGTNLDSYNRYTFYRLLSQLGTDTAPEPGGKLNLNYCNVDAFGYVVPNMATNFIPWTNGPQFFTNAAIRLLADAGYAVGDSGSISNNPNTCSFVSWPEPTSTASRSPLPTSASRFGRPTSTRRASTASFSSPPTSMTPPPTEVGFIPICQASFGRFSPTWEAPRVASAQISIIGYEDVTNASVLAQTMVDLGDINDRAKLKAPDDQHMVYNVPLVIGAKKGFPNFNEFAMQTLVQVSRKLQFTRKNGPNTPISLTNQMFMVAVSNVFAVEAWNSYAATFPRSLRLYLHARR